jgi:hypothetical protein
MEDNMSTEEMKAKRTGNTVVLVMLAMVLIGLDYAHIITWAQWFDLIAQVVKWIVSMIG